MTDRAGDYLLHDNGTEVPRLEPSEVERIKAKTWATAEDIETLTRLVSGCCG